MPRRSISGLPSEYWALGLINACGSNEMMTALPVALAAGTCRNWAHTSGFTLLRASRPCSQRKGRFLLLPDETLGYELAHLSPFKEVRPNAPVNPRHVVDFLQRSTSRCGVWIESPEVLFVSSTNYACTVLLSANNITLRQVRARGRGLQISASRVVF